MRLIDADRLKSYIDCGHLRPPTEVCFSELDVCNMIDKAPTVSAEARPTGEWIDIDNYYSMATCSHCHKVTMFEKWGEYIRPYNFCPNCGARMKGADDE